jgi:hypothetical protein
VVSEFTPGSGKRAKKRKFKLGKEKNTFLKKLRSVRNHPLTQKEENSIVWFTKCKKVVFCLLKIGQRNK